MIKKYVQVIEEKLESKYQQKDTQRSLELQNVKFKLFIPKISQLLQQFRFITSMKLTHCDIRNLENFPRYYNLQQLDLSHNQIQGTFNNLMPLKKLKYLNVEGNLIFQYSKLAPLRKIAGCQQQKSFKISICVKNNPFTKQQNPYITKLKSYGLKVIKQSQEYFDKKKSDEQKAKKLQKKQKKMLKQIKKNNKIKQSHNSSSDDSQQSSIVQSLSISSSEMNSDLQVLPPIIRMGTTNSINNRQDSIPGGFPSLRPPSNQSGNTVRQRLDREINRQLLSRISSYQSQRSSQPNERSRLLNFRSILGDNIDINRGQHLPRMGSNNSSRIDSLFSQQIPPQMHRLDRNMLQVNRIQDQSQLLRDGILYDDILGDQYLSGASEALNRQGGYEYLAQRRASRGIRDTTLPIIRRESSNQLRSMMFSSHNRNTIRERLQRTLARNQAQLSRLQEQSLNRQRSRMLERQRSIQRQIQRIQRTSIQRERQRQRRRSMLQNIRFGQLNIFQSDVNNIQRVSLRQPPRISVGSNNSGLDNHFNDLNERRQNLQNFLQDHIRQNMNSQNNGELFNNLVQQSQSQLDRFVAAIQSQSSPSQQINDNNEQQDQQQNDQQDQQLQIQMQDSEISEEEEEVSQDLQNINGYQILLPNSNNLQMQESNRQEDDDSDHENENVNQQFGMENMEFMRIDSEGNMVPNSNRSPANGFSRDFNMGRQQSDEAEMAIHFSGRRRVNQNSNSNAGQVVNHNQSVEVSDQQQLMINNMAQRIDFIEESQSNQSIRRGRVGQNNRNNNQNQLQNNNLDQGESQSNDL